MPCLRLTRAADIEDRATVERRNSILDLCAYAINGHEVAVMDCENVSRTVARERLTGRPGLDSEAERAAADLVAALATEGLATRPIGGGRSRLGRALNRSAAPAERADNLLCCSSAAPCSEERERE